MKWALRGLIGFLTLSVILTGTVQIPYVQTRIVLYATEMVTESLGMEMEIEIEVKKRRKKMEIATTKTTRKGSATW